MHHARAETATPGPKALFLAFLTVGLSGFGGVLPFARRMLVDRRAWLDDGDFNETLALCQSLPGPNILNLSVVVGSRFAGARGAFAAVIGLTAAPVVIVIALGALYQRYGSMGRLPGAIHALAAAVAGLSAATAIKMIRPLVAARSFGGLAIVALAFVAVGLLRLPLPWVMAVLAPLGMAIAWRTRA